MAVSLGAMMRVKESVTQKPGKNLRKLAKNIYNGVGLNRFAEIYKQN